MRLRGDRPGSRLTVVSLVRLLFWNIVITVPLCIVMAAQWAVVLVVWAVLLPVRLVESVLARVLNHRKEADVCSPPGQRPG